MFLINKSGTIALNFDHVLYAKCENNTDKLRASNLLYKGEHYALNIYYGDDYDGKIIPFHGSQSREEIEELNAAILLAYNFGVRAYDLASKIDQYMDTSIRGEEPEAYWILGQNPADSINLRKCSQIRIVDVTAKYRLEHPVSQSNYYALIASYNKLCGYKHQTLFTATSLEESKTALSILMKSYAAGRKMLDFSGYANTVYERYKNGESVAEKLGFT